MAEKRRGSQYQWCKSTGVVYPTVQNTVEDALKSILLLKGNRPIIIKTCSRTDSGVHALKAAFHVDIPKVQNYFFKPLTIKNKLNRYFAKGYSIRILDVIQVPDSFTFSKSCLSKTYIYRIGVFGGPVIKGKERKINIPITESQKTFFMFGKPFDLKKVEEALQLFVGEKDFGAFVRQPKRNTHPTVCNILSFTVEKAAPQMPCDFENDKYDYYQFKCTGTRFLFHMVRSMVGAVISVGMGKTSLDELIMLFENPVPSSWLSKIIVLPGHGLYLADTKLDPQKLIIEEKPNDLSLVSETENNKTIAKAA